MIGGGKDKEEMRLIDAEKDFTPIKDERYENGYEDGYNACIDELLKGEEG